MLAFGMPGMTEWVIILVIVLIFFGPGKLPDVFKKAGQGVKAFKDASEGKGRRADDEDEEEASEEEVVVRRKKKQPAQIEEKDELDDEAEAPVSEVTKSRKG